MVSRVRIFASDFSIYTLPDFGIVFRSMPSRHVGGIGVRSHGAARRMTRRKSAVGRDAERIGRFSPQRAPRMSKKTSSANFDSEPRSASRTNRPMGIVQLGGEQQSEIVLKRRRTSPQQVESN